MKINKTGFLQALGIVIYIGMVALVMSNGNVIFGKKDTNFTPVVVLTMFATSALICSLLVFYKPYLLFLKDKKKEAINTVVSTAASLFGFLILFFIVLFLTNK